MARKWQLQFLIASVFFAVQSAFAQELSGVKIGDTLDQAVRTVGMKPTIQNRMGPFRIIKWDLPDGNSLSATAAAQTGRILYAEADWGGKAQHALFADFPGMVYGRTSLGDIRRRFSSNGIAFSDRAPVVRIAKGLAFLNSYEVGKVVVTFITVVPRRQLKAAQSSRKVAGFVKLDAISIADPSYTASWGRPIRDKAYKPIEWK